MNDLALDGALAAPPADAAPAHPWRDDPPFPADAVLRGDTHGYVLPSGLPQRCHRADLVRQLRKEPWTEVVFVPEVSVPNPDAGPYAPGIRAPLRPEAAGLLDEYRAEMVRHARIEAGWTGALTLAMAAWAAAWFGEAGLRTLPGFFAAFCGAFFLLSLHGIRTARGVDADVFPRARQARRHWTWARAQPAEFTWALCMGLAAVFIFTLDTESAVRGAGLVKPAVWDGEVWRMLTGPMLHGGFYHAWMNVSALFALGCLVEAHTSRNHLAAVFLASVVGGSVLSLLLSGSASVGASGGVMGLVGFLWVIWRMRPAELPDGFGGRMKYAVGATALIGLLGVQFIDNWAHLGGLLAGAGTGWLLLRMDGASRAVRWGLHAAGIVSLAVLALAMVGAVRGTWRATTDPPPPVPVAYPAPPRAG